MPVCWVGSSDSYLLARSMERRSPRSGSPSGGGFAVLADEAVDYGVETGFGTAELHDAGDGQVHEGLDPGEGDDEVVEAHDGVDLVVDAADVGGDLGVEEGAGDDLERELHAGGGDVDVLVRAPVFALVDGAGDDLICVGGDALAMEGRRGDLALADVDGVVGGDEAFAEQDLHAAHGALLDEAGGLVDEDLADVLGVVDEDDGGAEEAIVSDVAVGAVEVLEEQDGAAEFDPGLEGVEGKRVLEAGRHAAFVTDARRCRGGDWFGRGFESGGGHCFAFVDSLRRGEHTFSGLWGGGLTRWKEGRLGFGVVETGGDNLLDAGLNLVDGGVFADGDDAVGFAGGDLLVLIVDAAVEVVGLALEAVFVGA